MGLFNNPLPDEEKEKIESIPFEEVIPPAEEATEKKASKWKKFVSGVKERLSKTTIPKIKTKWVILASIFIAGLLILYFFFAEIKHFLSPLKPIVVQPLFWYGIVLGSLCAVYSMYLFLWTKSRFWKWALAFLGIVLMIEGYSHGFISQKVKDIYTFLTKAKIASPTKEKEEAPADEGKEDNGDKVDVPAVVSVDTTQYIEHIASLTIELKQSQAREEALKAKNETLVAKIEVLQKELRLAKKPPAAIVGDPADKALIKQHEKTIRDLLAEARKKREEKTGSIPYQRGAHVRFYDQKN